MTDYIVSNFRDLTPSQVPAGMDARNGEKPVLEIKAYYSKDHRPRGLKVAVYRCTESDFGRCYDIMAAYNVVSHIAGFDRKPSPKVMAYWTGLIEARLDQIAEIALASEKPDAKAISELFATIPA
jgi:hypothetical protein